MKIKIINKEKKNGFGEALLWEHCGVVVRALDLQSEGRGFESHSVCTPLDKAFCPQLSLSTLV